MTRDTLIHFACPKCNHKESVDVAEHIPDASEVDVEGMARRVRLVVAKLIESFVEPTYQRIVKRQALSHLRQDEKAAALGREAMRLMLDPEE